MVELSEGCGILLVRAVIPDMGEPTVEGHKEADGVLRDPLADTIASALLRAGNQSRVVNDAVEDLALRWLRRTQAATVRPWARRQCVAPHRGRCRSRAGLSECSWIVWKKVPGSKS